MDIALNLPKHVFKHGHLCLILVDIAHTLFIPLGSHNTGQEVQSRPWT